jgi:hypothetical protein
MRLAVWIRHGHAGSQRTVSARAASTAAGRRPRVEAPPGISRGGAGVQAPAHRSDALPVGRQPHAHRSGTGTAANISVAPHEGVRRRRAAAARPDTPHPQTGRQRARRAGRSRSDRRPCRVRREGPEQCLAHGRYVPGPGGRGRWRDDKRACFGPCRERGPPGKWDPDGKRGPSSERSPSGKRGPSSERGSRRKRGPSSERGPRGESSRSSERGSRAEACCAHPRTLTRSTRRFEMDAWATHGSSAWG